MNYLQHVPIGTKTVYYRTDGTGRDSYIHNINGGLLTNDEVQRRKPKIVNGYSPMIFGKKEFGRKLPPYLDNKVTHYRSDGSGRDFYVTQTDGGRSNNIGGYYKNHPFRSYNILPPINSPRTDYFNQSQQFPSINQKRNRSNQKLSMPRFDKGKDNRAFRDVRANTNSPF